VAQRAGVAQLAERQPSKLHVAGSRPVSRSTPLRDHSMTRVVEIRSYRLKPDTQDEYDRLFREEALPLLQRAGVDVVRAGRLLDDPDGYHLIPSLADRGDGA